eukprot:12573338-Heterocapsa_arctica.AAC.1
MHTKGFQALRSYIQEQVQNFRASTPQAMDLNLADAPDAGWYDNTVYHEEPAAQEGEDLPLDYFSKGKGQKGKGKGKCKGKEGKGDGK